MELTFKDSQANTLGIELEMRLLDLDSYGVKNCSHLLFEHSDPKIKQHIHKELLGSMFEVVTPVCQHAEEAVDFIHETLDSISQLGHEHGFLVAALATHPFEKKVDNEIIHDARYEAFEEEFQIVIRNFLISGLHIHVGIESADEAVRVYNAMINYIPLFQALTTNSPFFHAEDTGLGSYRTKVFGKLPRAGIPQYFDSYDEYTKLYRQLHSAKMIESTKDIWWDLRLSPGFGTLELRVCDAFYDKDRLRFVVMLYQALAAYSKSVQPEREYHQINMQNKWNATRHGLNGYFVKQGKRILFREKIHALIERLDRASIFEMLGTREAVMSLRYIVDKPCLSERLRKCYQETGSFKEVIKMGVVCVEE